MTARASLIRASSFSASLAQNAGTLMPAIQAKTSSFFIASFFSDIRFTVQQSVNVLAFLRVSRSRPLSRKDSTPITDNSAEWNRQNGHCATRNDGTSPGRIATVKTTSQVDYGCDSHHRLARKPLCSRVQLSARECG